VPDRERQPDRRDRRSRCRPLVRARHAAHPLRRTTGGKAARGRDAAGQRCHRCVRQRRRRGRRGDGCGAGRCHGRNEMGAGDLERRLGSRGADGEE
jgi:hypothetical protein